MAVTITKQGKVWILSGTYLCEDYKGRGTIETLEPTPFKTKWLAEIRKGSWERSDAEVIETNARILAARRADVEAYLMERADRAKQLRLF